MKERIELFEKLNSLYDYTLDFETKFKDDLDLDGEFLTHIRKIKTSIVNFFSSIKNQSSERRAVELLIEELKEPLRYLDGLPLNKWLLTIEELKRLWPHLKDLIDYLSLFKSVYEILEWLKNFLGKRIEYIVKKMHFDHAENKVLEGDRVYVKKNPEVWEVSHYTGFYLQYNVLNQMGLFKKRYKRS